MTKAELRRHFRVRRADYVASLAAGARRQLEHSLTLMLAPEATGVVATYAATGDEVDPGRRFAGQPALLPRMRADLRLDFAAPTTLVRHPFGIEEPDVSAVATDPDVILVPLLAVDSDGYRLGQGGGYYDRTLAALRARRPIVAIGCAWDVQIVDRLPRDAWDEPLDGVVTPTDWMRLRRG